MRIFVFWAKNSRFKVKKCNITLKLDRIFREFWSNFTEFVIFVTYGHKNTHPKTIVFFATYFGINSQPALDDGLPGVNFVVFRPDWPFFATFCGKFLNQLNKFLNQLIVKKWINFHHLWWKFT